VLEDVWGEVAIGDKDAAKRIIDELPESHPFELRYTLAEEVYWASCMTVLDAAEKERVFAAGW
jgi:hypothetical protein